MGLGCPFSLHSLHGLHVEGVFCHYEFTIFSVLNTYFILEALMSDVENHTVMISIEKQLGKKFKLC